MITLTITFDAWEKEDEGYKKLTDLMYKNESSPGGVGGVIAESYRCYITELVIEKGNGSGSSSVRDKKDYNTIHKINWPLNH